MRDLYIETIRGKLAELQLNRTVLEENLSLFLLAGNISLNELAKELDCSVTTIVKYRDRIFPIPICFFSRIFNFLCKRAEHNLKQNNYWLTNLLFCFFMDNTFKNCRELKEKLLGVNNDMPIIKETSEKFIFSNSAFKSDIFILFLPLIFIPLRNAIYLFICPPVKCKMNVFLKTILYCPSTYPFHPKIKAQFGKLPLLLYYFLH